MSRAKDRNEVSRVIPMGNGLYVCIPMMICEEVGIKRGDRLAVDTDGRAVYFVRVPMEELLDKRKLRRGAETVGETVA